VVWVLYLLSSIAVMWMAAAIWKSEAPPNLRFSGLVLAAVLVNPHIYIYDLLVLAPVLLLLTDWTLQNNPHRFAPALAISLYFTFLLPLFGPLAFWTHLQISVPAFTALLWILWRISSSPRATRGQLVSGDRVVV